MMRDFWNLSGGKFITLGELLLRLTPPDHGMLAGAEGFLVHYGGSEANIALALANWGVDSSFFTVVPGNPLGRAALGHLRRYGVDCGQVILSTPAETPTHRMGTYYLEAGFGPRASRVVYDRKHSALAEYDLAQVDVKKLLAGYHWLHLSGITPALSRGCAELVLRCLAAAKELGLVVSFDGNFRSALWSWGQARDFCTQCLPYVDVLLGIEPYHLWKDPENLGEGDVKDGLPMRPDRVAQTEVFEKFAERYPNLRCIARHVREAPNSSENSLKAYLWMEGETVESPSYTFQILDRVGGGDAFAAGLIYALFHCLGPQEAVNFAVAASVLKHSIAGDACLMEDLETLRGLGNSGGDIRR